MAVDVQRTQVSITKLKKLGFSPKFEFEQGLRAFVDWYRSKYGNV